MPAKVVVRDLWKRYGGVEAARGVSFAIEEGEVFGLLGPNGAGKTTTLECLLGLREPDSGVIEICGIDARRNPREVKRKIGAALQKAELQDKITPREAIGAFRAFYSSRADPQKLLDRFALQEKADAPFDSLSGGQKQRLALALAFVNDPELVFLDETTAGLDARSRHDLHGEIARMKRDGHTVLLTTHYIDEAEQLCDRIAIIDRGKIIAIGAPRDVIAQSSAAAYVSLATAPAVGREALAALPGIEDLITEGNAVRFQTESLSRTLAELMKLLDAQGAQLAEMHVRKASLEDVFLQLTGTSWED